MKKTIKGNIPIEGIKRCYVEGAILKADCPQCNSLLTADLSGDYLSYPEIGKETSIYFYCPTCEDGGAKDYEFVCIATVIEASITIEYDPSSIKKYGE